MYTTEVKKTLKGKQKVSESHSNKSPLDLSVTKTVSNNSSKILAIQK